MCSPSPAGAGGQPLYTSVIPPSIAWVLWWRSLPGLVPAGLTMAILDAKARSEEEWLRAGSSKLMIAVGEWKKRKPA